MSEMYQPEQYGFEPLEQTSFDFEPPKALDEVVVEYAAELSPELKGLSAEMLKSIRTERGVTDAMLHVVTRNGKKATLRISALVASARQKGDQAAVQALAQAMDMIIEPLRGAERQSMQDVRERLFGAIAS